MILVTILLLSLMGLVTFLGKGLDLAHLTNRAAVWAAGMGVLLGAVAPNPYLGVFFAVSGIAIMLRPQPSQILYEDVYWSLALAGAYIAAVPFVTREMIPWLLGGISLVGVATAGYWKWSDITAGQGNVMHTQGICALASAASCG